MRTCTEWKLTREKNHNLHSKFHDLLVAYQWKGAIMVAVKDTCNLYFHLLDPGQDASLVMPTTHKLRTSSPKEARTSL
jgi:hypothetical protein